MFLLITTQSLISLFQQALKERWGYIWGTAGEQWTAAKQAALEKTTDSDRANGRKYGSKWIGHTVADCSGLFSWAFRKLGGYMYHGSDTMYRKYCSNKGELKKGKRTDCGNPATSRLSSWGSQRKTGGSPEVRRTVKDLKSRTAYAIRLLHCCLIYLTVTVFGALPLPLIQVV